ncbi:DUF2892 domain-containing protein [Clostridium sp.]|uniref:YgaP family membrane protein n=1 Tax=Clostridium sp. TaxID=1506 RepID=UPI002843D40C|nr:DUF2892 domain-containing protein [Clostridium sp.]MDR3596305.1 DUF2892 domain-containing protein [Clostridium sp.]
MKNRGYIDKVFKFVVGLILLSLLFWGDGYLKYFGLIGLVPIISAIFDFCPLCLILGKKSCKIKK